MTTRLFLTFTCIGTGLFTLGCWDQVSQELDINDDTSAVSTANETENSTDSLTADTHSPDPSSDKRNTVLANDWAGFGAGCSDVSECDRYPAAHKRCLQNVMGLVNCPGGYCTACCNEPGEGVCGQGVDCVGASNAYLICLERCETDADCRTEDHYICHEGLYYMEDTFTGKYCLPDADHIVPDTDSPPFTPCPWPWL